MNALNQHKTEILNEVISNGCTIPSKILETYLDTLILLAKTDQQIEDNQAFLTRIGDLITEPESLKPEDLINGEWYILAITKNTNVFEYLFKHKKYDKDSDAVCYYYMKNITIGLEMFGIRLDDYLDLTNEYSIRKATKEEVQKYFPDEFKEIEPNTDHPNTI